MPELAMATIKEAGGRPEAQEEASSEVAEKSGFEALFSPEAMVMLPLAFILDLAGILLGIFGLNGITAIIGFVFINGWIYLRSQTLQSAGRGRASKSKKIGKWTKRLRWLTPLVKFIPWLGILSSWTLLVWLELKNS